MKCQAVQLLVSLLLGISTGAIRQRRGTKISDVKKLGARGIVCQNAGQQFCHGTIVKQYGRNYANVCNDGDVNLMRIFPGYAGPLACNLGGKTYCSGDKVSGGGSVFVEQVCEDGEVFFINKITGLKFQKGRLRGSSEDSKSKEENKNKKRKPSKFNKVVSKTSTTTTPTTTSTTTTTTSTTTSTTTTPTTTSTTTTITTSMTEAITELLTSISSKPISEEPIFNDVNSIDLKATISTMLDEIERTTPMSADGSSSTSSTVLPMSMVSMEYVNTILEENMPYAKVLQCWEQYSICFIQIGPDLPMLGTGQDLP